MTRYQGDLENLEKLYNEKINSLETLLEIIQQKSFTLEETNREIEIEAYITLISKKERLFEKMKGLDDKIYGPLYEREADIMTALIPLRQEKETEIENIVQQIIENETKMKDMAQVFMSYIKRNLRDVNEARDIADAYTGTQRHGSVFIDRQG